MDIWIAARSENAARMVSVLQAFGFNPPELSPELFLSDNIIRMGYPPIRIEITTTISGVQFDECYLARILTVLDGIEVSLIDLENLKRNKRASGRHKDLDDLEHLP